MTYPIAETEIRRHVAELLAHLPNGPMRGSLAEQAESAPVRAFEMLVSYYSAEEEHRLRIRCMFYGLASGETVSPHTPTSGELAEQMGAVEVPTLPEHLVTLCRTRLMPIVHEHSQAEDVNEEEVAAALMGMGLVETDESSSLADVDDPVFADVIDEDDDVSDDFDEDFEVDADDDDDDDTWAPQWRPDSDSDSA